MDLWAGKFTGTPWKGRCGRQKRRNKITDSNVAPNCHHHLSLVPSSLSPHPARVLSPSVILACPACIREQPRCDHPCPARLPTLPSFGTSSGSSEGRTTCSRQDCTSAWLRRDIPRPCRIYSERDQARCDLPFHTIDASRACLSTVPDGPLTVIIDSADVLCADLESPSSSYALIATLLSTVIARPGQSVSSLYSPTLRSTSVHFFRALASHPTLRYALSTSRSRPRSAPLSYARTRRHSPACAPGAPCDRAAHAPAPCEHA